MLPFIRLFFSKNNFDPLNDLSNIQKEILTGSMLGDGHMFSSKIARSFKLV
jgi:hypothetical protein